MLIVLSKDQGRNSPNNSIALLKNFHIRTNVVYFTGNIVSKDGREFFDEDPDVCHVAVDGIDGYGGVIHDDFAWTRDWKRCRLDFEGKAGFVDLGGEVLSIGHFAKRVV